ncbi:MAG: 50S ribosome-binding GTPase, partial [Lachnospiraceae bacterium]|nr:50S ribosome-binding GTPase [Lachnospiraceae bacterium]
MNITQAELQTVCGVTSKLPVNEFPEFAFAGRSNVGKSSLLNLLTGRKKLAHVSGNPGKTRTINFYLINPLIRISKGIQGYRSYGKNYIVEVDNENDELDQLNDNV